MPMKPHRPDLFTKNSSPSKVAIKVKKLNKFFISRTQVTL